MIEPARPEPGTEVAAERRLERVEAYKDEVARVVSSIPRATIDLWSIFRDDALALTCFLDCLSGKDAVLDVGTFVGVSAFLFASHPSVVHVTTVDPNPLVREELQETGATAGLSDIPEVDGPSRNSRVHDIAREALKRFPEERAKIHIQEGVIASTDGAHRIVPIPDPAAHGAARLIAFVDGLHTTEAVRADVDSVFNDRPDAIVFLDDCRYFWGPFVQAGVAANLEKRPGLSFRLIADVSDSLGSCTLGIVYAEGVADEVEDTLARVAEMVRSTYGTLALVEAGRKLNDRLRQLERELEALAEQRDLARADADEAQTRLSEIVDSTSWRIVTALRRFGRRANPLP
jgi:hypothetical protein